MKALCLGLLKGSIDQVEQKVHMTWVQPRVLDKEQVPRVSHTLVRSLLILLFADWNHAAEVESMVQ
jgi:26S proteasome regulatory subunit N9